MLYVVRMPIGQPIDAHTENQVIKALSLGKTQPAIATSVGLDQSTISRIGSKHRDIIDKARLRIIEAAVPAAVRTATVMVTNYSQPKRRKAMDAQDRKHAFAFTMETLKSSGILGTHTGTSPLMIAIYNDNRGHGHDWQKTQEYGQFLDWKREQDIQEAEIMEDEGHNEGDIEGSHP